MGEPLVYRSPGVGVRRVAALRRAASVFAGFYALGAAVGTALGGPLVLASFLAFFGYMGLPLVAHWRRISDPATQTSAGWLYGGTLTVDTHTVHFSGSDGGLVAPRTDITDGWIEPFGQGGQRVVLRLQSGDLGVVEVATPADGHAILEAVGFSAERHALRVRTSGNANQTLREMGLVVAVFVLTVPLFALGFAEEPASIAVGAIAAVLCAAVVVLLGMSTVAPVVRVGLDGIEITRGRTRSFIPVGEVNEVMMTPSGVEVWTRGEVGVPGTQERVVLRCWGVQQAALFSRIQEVVRGFGGAAASAAQLARLDRQGRDLAGWREALRQLAADDGGDYRRIGLARDDLARLLGQGDAPPERRIGAALALAASGEPAERDRVRVAARACASEELRAVLERIAEDEVDEAAVDAALRPRSAQG